MNWKFLFFSLQGRISRKDWWVGMLVILIASYGMSIGLLYLLGEDPTFYWNDQLPTPQTAMVEAIVFVIILRASFAVDIKRIHDRGRTAYLLVPVYLGELALITLDSKGINPLYFPPEQNTSSSLMPTVLLGLIAILVAYTIWLIIELGFGKGPSSPNKYGPDPLLLTQPADETI